MPGKRTINLPDGRSVEASVLTFRSGGEHWNEYLIDDGAVIRVKLVATEVLRLDGEYDGNGNPVYIVQSTNVMAVDAPEGLRRGGDS
jgi:hypothetical protein